MTGAMFIAECLKQEGVTKVFGQCGHTNYALIDACHKLGIEEGGTTADGLFTVQKSECLGACADAPVMLVNDRQMLSFMSHARLDELVETLKAAGTENRA